MAVSLGGSLFTHNVKQFDYCFEESIACLLDLCDQVVVLDAESTDGTLDDLRAIAAANSKIKLVEGALWDCAPKHERLRVLANQAKSHLTTDWHFMLQADEVIHESSFDVIRRLINDPNQKHSTFGVRRFNLFGDFNHYIGLHSAHKPCNDAPVRLGRIDIPAMGDAESLDMVASSWAHVTEILTFHYGLVRRSAALVDKSIDMQTWFHDADAVDWRIKEMKASGVFDPFRLVPRSEIVPLDVPHPKYMAKWIAERMDEKKAWM